MVAWKPWTVVPPASRLPFLLVWYLAVSTQRQPVVLCSDAPNTALPPSTRGQKRDDVASGNASASTLFPGAKAVYGTRYVSSSNAVTYNERCYAALDGASPTSTALGCQYYQSGYLAIFAPMYLQI